MVAVNVVLDYRLDGLWTPFLTPGMATFGSLYAIFIIITTTLYILRHRHYHIRISCLHFSLLCVAGNIIVSINEFYCNSKQYSYPNFIDASSQYVICIAYIWIFNIGLTIVFSSMYAKLFFSESIKLSAENSNVNTDS